MALISAALLGSVTGTGAGVAQTPDPPGVGTLTGVVLDASTGEPVSSVLVTLEPAGGGLVAAPRAAGALGATRTVVTTASGAYRFTDLTVGRYRLRLERFGYRGQAVEVDMRRPVDATVSVGLELEPVALEPMAIAAQPAPLFQRAANAPLELDEARIASERERQSLFLSPDARVVTYADVMDGVTLGEGDVFRALQRFPGVGTRDDYTAEIWTRGAPWTHTRVTFDGVPLFNPVHAIGVLSAIMPEVLGTVFFHPGVRPASLPEGGDHTGGPRHRLLPPRRASGLPSGGSRGGRGPAHAPGERGRLAEGRGGRFSGHGEAGAGAGGPRPGRLGSGRKALAPGERPRRLRPDRRRYRGPTPTASTI